MPISPQHERAMTRYRELAKPLAARDITGLPLMPDFYKEHKTTAGTASKVRCTREYKDAFAAFTKKQARLLGDEFKEFTLETKNKLREYSDQAPLILYKIMVNESEKAPARIAAATEIMDRDGRFAKVSRLMNVREGMDGSPMLPEDAANEILDALAAAKRKPN